jgi:hypothetical protein
LERNDLPLVVFFYDEQRWAGFYLARLIAFLELHLHSGGYHRDIGAQKADAPQSKGLGRKGAEYVDLGCDYHRFLHQQCCCPSR